MRGRGRGRERTEVTVHQAAAAAAAAAESSPAEATVAAESATAEAAAEAAESASAEAAESASAEAAVAADSISGYIVPSNHQLIDLNVLPQIDLNVLPGPQPPSAGDLNLTLGAITGSGGAAAPSFPALEAESLNRASQLPLPPDTLEFVYGLVPGNDVLQIFANPLYKPVEGAATKDVQDSISSLSNLVPRDTRRGILLSYEKAVYAQGVDPPKPVWRTNVCLDPEHPTKFRKLEGAGASLRKLRWLWACACFPIIWNPLTWLFALGALVLAIPSEKTIWWSTSSFVMIYAVTSITSRAR